MRKAALALVFSMVVPAYAKEVPAASGREIARAIQKYVSSHLDKKRAGYLLPDDVEETTWLLKLEKVRTDSIAELSAGRFKACADFVQLDPDAGESPAKLDLDFYLAAPGGKSGGWKVEQVLIHMVDGEPRASLDEDSEEEESGEGSLLDGVEGPAPEPEPAD